MLAQVWHIEILQDQRQFFLIINACSLQLRKYTCFETTS
jgi:hypothetical protein